MASPRLACLSSLLWPGLAVAPSPADGSGLDLGCGAFQPFIAPARRHPQKLRLGGNWHEVIGSGRYGLSALRGGAAAPMLAEVTIWILADGRFVIEPLIAAHHAATLQGLTLGAHLGADARGICGQMAGLHLLRIGPEDLIDTADGPRPAHSLVPGQRVGTLNAGPQPLRAVLACRGSGRGGARPWRIAAEAFGNAAPLTLPPSAHILHFTKNSLRPIALAKLTARPGVAKLSAEAVDWIALGFDAPHSVAAQGLFLQTSPAENG